MTICCLCHASGVARIWRVVGPTREARKLWLWDYWHFILHRKHIYRHPYTFDSTLHCKIHFPFCVRAFSISRESISLSRASCWHSTVTGRAELATTNYIASKNYYSVSLIFEWSGMALLGPFLATPLDSGKLTSHDLPGHSEIHQGLGPYGPRCSYATVPC